MTHQYHKVLPVSNQSAGFLEYDSIDFLINASPDRALVADSILMEFDLEVFKTGSTRVTTALKDEICVSSANVLFDSFRVEVENKGVVENLLNYGRYCYMVDKMTKSRTDKFNNVDMAAGNVVLRDNQFYNSQQQASQTTGTSIKSNNSFCFKPKICFNRSVGGNYQFQNGYIKVSTTLARNVKALYGRYSATTDMSFRIKNISLRYESIPSEMSSTQPMMAFSYKSIKSAVQSQSNNIQAVVPSKACSGVMMSFVKQGDDNSFTKNSQEMQVLRGISGLRFLYNSNLGERVAYQIQDLDEMLKQGVEVLNSNQVEKNQIKRKALSANDCFLLGMDFKSIIDLSNVNTEVNIQLDSTYSGNVHNAYLYFVELLQLN